MQHFVSVMAFVASVMIACPSVAAERPEVVAVEGQPLAGNVKRLLDTLDFLGAPLSPDATAQLRQAAAERDAVKLQRLLDPHVLLVVTINPESRVKVARGPAVARLQQGGYTPIVVKVINEGVSTAPLKINSPQAGPVYTGESAGSLTRQAQLQLKSDGQPRSDNNRFLHLEMFTSPPLTANLSGLEAEYTLALVYSSESGKREATIGFDIGQGNQDLGFRGETPVLFDVRPAAVVKLAVKDFDGRPTIGRFMFRDKSNHIYPPQAKRLAPDFFFQQQVYRADGDTVVLPPGELTMQYSRGPEYRVIERKIRIPDQGESSLAVQLERWVNPMDYGFYCGDHHIHAAGCAHYTSPTEGVTGRDMFLQVKGEGLNVGCILTWGPCYDYQRKFFSPSADRLSEPLTVVKYDIEVSGFGSQALGHVCLLNLKDQTYPGSDGTSTKGPRGPRPSCVGPRSKGPSPATPIRRAGCRSIRQPPRGA